MKNKLIMASLLVGSLLQASENFQKEHMEMQKRLQMLPVTVKINELYAFNEDYSAEQSKELDDTTKQKALDLYQRALASCQLVKNDIGFTAVTLYLSLTDTMNNNIRVEFVHPDIRKSLAMEIAEIVEQCDSSFED